MPNHIVEIRVEEYDGIISPALSYICNCGKSFDYVSDAQRHIIGMSIVKYVKKKKGV